MTYALRTAELAVGALRAEERERRNRIFQRNVHPVCAPAPGFEAALGAALDAMERVCQPTVVAPCIFGIPGPPHASKIAQRWEPFY